MDETRSFRFENVRPVLAEVAKFFEQAKIPYGFNVGTAAYFYGSTRDLDDIDVLTTKEGVDAFGKGYSAKPFLKQEGMFHDYLVKTTIKGIDVDVVSNLTIVKGGKKYPFTFDEKMVKDRRKIVLDGQILWLISSEDIIAFKSITQREGNGKFDLTDIKNIMQSAKINQKLVSDRLKRAGFIQ